MATKLAPRTWPGPSNELIAKGYHDADALAAVSKVEAKDADTAVITLKTPNLQPVVDPDRSRRARVRQGRQV